MYGRESKNGYVLMIKARIKENVETFYYVGEYEVGLDYFTEFTDDINDATIDVVKYSDKTIEHIEKECTLSGTIRCFKKSDILEYRNIKVNRSTVIIEEVLVTDEVTITFKEDDFEKQIKLTDSKYSEHFKKYGDNFKLGNLLTLRSIQLSDGYDAKYISSPSNSIYVLDEVANIIADVTIHGWSSVNKELRFIIDYREGVIVKIDSIRLTFGILNSIL